MSVQKQYSKPSYFAFCPAAPLVVAGTAVYGQLETEASQPALEILSLDLAKPGLELPRQGASVPLKSSLLSVEWGSFGIAAKKSKYGILAGSLNSGEVVLWDPMAIVNQASAKPVIHSWKPSESGYVNSLAFDPHTPSMLACGTNVGEVMLYDITNPLEPRDALAAADAAPSSTVVPYAPQFRNRRKVLEFVDENLPRRIAGVAWAPSDETHLVLASADDRSPTLQFWDLRKARAPTLEFVGHSRGVTDVAWCPQDSGLLLSSGKDAQSIVWDTRSGERLGCLNASDPGAAIQVRWSPLSHGMFMSSQAGKGVHMAHYAGIACSFEAVTDPTTGQMHSQMVSRPLPKPPTWMRRRAVARFGFGGKIAVSTPPIGRDSVRAVSVRTLTLEPELKAHSEAFEEAISGDLRSYCQQKAHAEADPEREYWSFIEVLLGSDDERMPEMLSRLGFANEVSATQRPGASEQVENVTALLGASGLIANENNAHMPPEEGARPFFDVDNPQGHSPRGGGGGGTPMGGQTSFFDNLGAQAAQTPTYAAGAAAAGRGGPSASMGQTLSIGDSGALEAEAEGETDLQRQLFVGNHASAVATCLSHDRLADALVVAHVSNDPALWRSTLSRYMELCPQPYLRVIEAQMREDYESLVKTRPVGRWAETAAILLTYVPQPDFKRLCTKLAKRLDESGMRHAAALCYICCADVDAAVTLWLSEATDASLPVPRLQSVLEKSISLCLAAAHQAATASLADLLANYALRLVDQGAMRSAITYLSLLDQLPTESVPSLAVLKDRVSQCSPTQVPEGIQPAMFPYEYVLVPTSVQGAAAQQEVYNQYAAQQQQYDYSQQQQYSAPSSATSQYPANTYGGYQSSSSAAYNQYKYDPSGAYGQDSYLNQQYAPAEPKPPAKPTQHHGYVPPPQTAQQQSFNTPSRTSSVRSAAPLQPAAHSYAPQAPKPPAQPAVPAQYHHPQQHVPQPPAKPATQYAPRAPHSPQPYSPTSQYSHQAPDPPPQKQPAVFQPMHAQAPRHAMTPQPPAPAPQPAAPPAPAAPPPPPPGPPTDCSIHNVDTSAVAGPAQQVVQNLYSLFQACEPLAQNALQQREMEDNAKKLGILFWKLNAHEISDEVVGLLVPLAQALTAGDIATAKSIHVKLTGSYWNECSQWLQVIKRLTKARQQLQ